MFRKIILTQILLFSFTLRLKQGHNKEDERVLLNLDEQINHILGEMNGELVHTINKLIETEKIWVAGSSSRFQAAVEGEKPGPV